MSELRPAMAGFLIGACTCAAVVTAVSMLREPVYDAPFTMVALKPTDGDVIEYRGYRWRHANGAWNLMLEDKTAERAIAQGDVFGPTQVPPCNASTKGDYRSSANGHDLDVCDGEHWKLAGLPGTSEHYIVTPDTPLMCLFNDEVQKWTPRNGYTLRWQPCEHRK